jgi:hypothetical protein
MDWCQLHGEATLPGNGGTVFTVAFPDRTNAA